MKNTNFVIKAESPEHAKKILEYFISLGSVDALNVKNNRQGHPFFIGSYYGFIDKVFDCYSLRYITEHQALITELPPEPKRGDWVCISDDPIDPNNTEELHKAIFVAKIEGDIYPFVTVVDLFSESFMNDNNFVTMKWRYMLPIPKTPKIFTLEQVKTSFYTARDMKMPKERGVAWEYVYETFEDYLKTI